MKHQHDRILIIEAIQGSNIQPAGADATIVTGRADANYAVVSYQCARCNGEYFGGNICPYCGGTSKSSTHHILRYDG